VALTGTKEGSLLVWVPGGGVAASSSSSFSSAREPSHNNTTLSSATRDLVKKSPLKFISVVRPEFQKIARGEKLGVPGAEAVNVLTLTPNSKYFMVGSADGCVRLYDLHCRLLAWWEDLGGGPISCLAFSREEWKGGAARLANQHLLCDALLQGVLASIPPFLVSTKRALAIHVTPESFLTLEDSLERRGEVLFEGLDSPVTALAVLKEGDGGEGLLAVALSSGYIQVWNSQQRALVLVRELQYAPSGSLPGGLFQPSVMVQDPLGRTLAVGTVHGFLLLLDPRTMADTQGMFAPPQWDAPLAAGGRKPGAPITHAVFSPDGYHLATGDAAGFVSLYRYTRKLTKRPVTVEADLSASRRLLLRKPWEGLIPESQRWVDSMADCWVYIGRVKAHRGGGGGGGGMLGGGGGGGGG